MWEVKLIMPEHFLAQLRVHKETAGVQQHRGWIADIQSMDGEHSGETRQNCRNSRHGANRSLLVCHGKIPEGNWNEVGTCKFSPCEEIERAG